MEIPTSRGLVILVDDADAYLVRPYSWYANRTSGGRVYAHARVPGAGKGGKRIVMHRLLMQPPAAMVVHHINNDGLDNRRENLVVVTPLQHKHEHCGPVPGTVHIHKQTGKWRAQKRRDGKIVSLGLFDTAEDARAALAAAAPSPCTAVAR